MISLAVRSDLLANRIRNLSTLSARRFMAEEDDRSLQSAINDQKSVVDEMKQIQSEINNITEEALTSSENDLSQLPQSIHEKITNTQEAIKQSLNEELERRSSLLDIKRSTELRQNKIDSLNHNLELIQKIFDKKIPNEENEAQKSSSSFNNSLLESESLVFDNINLNHSEYSRYLNSLTKCKKLIQNSKQLANELKLPTGSSPIFFSMASGSRSSPTPSYHEYHELREIELKLDSFAHQLDFQIDIFETNLAKHAKLDKKFEKLDKSLNDLVEKFHMYDLGNT